MTIELTRNFLLSNTYTYKTQKVLKAYVITGLVLPPLPHAEEGWNIHPIRGF